MYELDGVGLITFKRQERIIFLIYVFSWIIYVSLYPLGVNFTIALMVPVAYLTIIFLMLIYQLKKYHQEEYQELKINLWTFFSIESILLIAGALV
jgi:hypothetical protein